MESKLKGNYRKTSPGGISKDRNKVGASFKIDGFIPIFNKKANSTYLKAGVQFKHS